MDHHLLVSDLQALVVESKRRYPEVKDASEHALELLKDGPLVREKLFGHAEELLKPITLGCKTKVAKIVGISIAALQRLVSLGGVPTSELPQVFQTLASVANQAVDTQLKILQVLLGILTHNTDLHDDVLGGALLLCFKLQESRVSVVSSTAAATLRQAVMLVFDRISSDVVVAEAPLTLPSDPPIELTVTPSTMDAYNILSDLCLHTGASSSGISLWGGAEKEKPRILKLGSLTRTFGLELIESILGGYEKEIKQHPELIFLLRTSLSPLLLKLQAEKPSFPIALRVHRLIFLLIRFFVKELGEEIQVFLLLLLKVGAGDFDGEEQTKKDVSMPYQRVLALEALRGICGDSALLQQIYTMPSTKDGTNSNLFVRLISAISHLVHEKPALMGINAEIYGLGVPSDSASSSGYLDMGFGIVSAAASAGVSTVSSMMGSAGGGLGSHSGVKQKLIEQHDKAEPPPTPESYPYLLALQSLMAVAEGIYHAVAQNVESLDSVRVLADSAWPPLLAALSFSISTNLSDAIFAELITAFQNFTLACGLLGLNSPRDALLSTLGKYAVPSPVVSAMQSYSEGSTGRSASAVGAEALGLTALGVGGPSGPPSLSERNLACLKSVVTIARTLSSSLGEAWHDVLEVLQNANFLISRRPLPTRRPTIASPIIGTPSKLRESVDSQDRPDAFTDLDIESLQTNINALFDSTRDLDNEAFSTFIAALCTLNTAMMGTEGAGMSNDRLDSPSMPSTPKSPGLFSPSDTIRRRASGLQVSNNMKSGERSFSLTKLRAVATSNISRLITSDPSIAWNPITQHLLDISRHSTAPITTRIQASDTLGELLMAAMRGGQESRVQHQVFDVLVHQVDVHPTLNHILESSGHSLEVGWETIFNMLNSVCNQSSSLKRTDSSMPVMSTQTFRPTIFLKGDINLVRVAFPAINLICTDFLSSLDPKAMRSCIACLGRFGSQKEAVNISLASIGLMWNVSDAVQGTSKDLWLYLLRELLELSRDDRLEVRSGAMQTLFRCLEIYGSVLDTGLWSKVLDTVVFPLLESARPDESQDLALTSVGTIFSSFLPQLSTLPAYSESYRHLLDILLRSFSNQHKTCCTAALKALERIVPPITRVNDLYITWEYFVRMAATFDSSEPFTQETLVVFVRVAKLLHDQMEWKAEEKSKFSEILRGIMTYSRSPEYRLDVDMMSPLQQLIAELIASSRHLGNSIVLSDLAEFTTLAFAAESSTSGRLTYIALAKFCMPQLGSIFAEAASDPRIFTDGTVQAVLGALLIPIKLKYDCPSPSKYGNDPPLWRTALDTAVPILQSTLSSLDTLSIDAEQVEAIWILTMEIFAATLLAEGSDKESTLDEDEQSILPWLSKLLSAIRPRLGMSIVPDRIREQHGEILYKASLLYRHERSDEGRGTTAPIILYEQEEMRYWSFDALIASSSSTASKQNGKGKAKETDESVARACLAALIRRVSTTLREFIQDARLRGQMPFPREEELMFILRHLVVMRVIPNTLPEPLNISQIMNTALSTSSRAHLFSLYPLLLDLSVLPGPVPSMWIFPDEHSRLFESSVEGDDIPNGVNEESSEGMGVELIGEEGRNAGDGGDLIEVTAKDLARRCLELVGIELGLSR